MTDLTKITTPFGLLDAETQDALRAHGGPYETWAGCDPTEWKNCPSPAWMGAGTYRVKPQPPKPREWWSGFVGEMHMGMWPTEELAHKALRDCTGIYRLVRVREVLE